MPPGFSSTGSRYVMRSGITGSVVLFLVSPECVLNISPWHVRPPFLYCSQLGTMSKILDNRKRPTQYPVTTEYYTLPSAQQNENPIVNRKHRPKRTFGDQLLLLEPVLWGFIHSESPPYLLKHIHYSCRGKFFHINYQEDTFFSPYHLCM